jgi:cysteinyl-tRNA synthetase
LLSLYNSMTRDIEIFEPKEKEKVKMFTCGPSIYQPAHLGNYRTFLFEDILLRYLEYSGYNVERTLNFTDVEDKTISEAEKNSIDIFSLTNSCAAKFFMDIAELDIKKPTYNPRSSTSVAIAVKIIERLLQKEHAYWYKGNVYFDIRSFKDFGKLGHLKSSDWPAKIRRFHRDTYPGSNWNIGDFVLWHGHRNEDGFSWESTLGRGRPSWNIQDPAMLCDTLGPTVDIWCGGEDNLVRHHDYNIAVMESATGEALSRYWLHGAHLLVDGKKMSKSRGNVIYPEELLANGHSGKEVRFFLMYGHYRKRLNFTHRSMEERTLLLRDIITKIDILKRPSPGNSSEDLKASGIIKRIIPTFNRHMDNDLDARSAFDSLAASILELVDMHEQGMLGKENIKDLIIAIEKTNEVLRVF